MHPLCGQVVAGTEPYFLTPSFLFPKKEVNRQQWMAHGQCWKDRMEEQAGEKVHRGPALRLMGLPFLSQFLGLWLFQRQKSLRNKLSKLPPSLH